MIRIIIIKFSGLISQIVSCFRPFSLNHEEIIIKDNWMCKEIYFIKKGTVELSINKNNKYETIGISCTGSYFGDISALLDIKNPVQYSASSFCDLFFITIYDIDNITITYNSFKDYMIESAETYNEAIQTIKRSFESDNNNENVGIKIESSRNPIDTDNLENQLPGMIEEINEKKSSKSFKKNEKVSPEISLNISYKFNDITATIKRMENASSKDNLIYDREICEVNGKLKRKILNIWREKRILSNNYNKKHIPAYIILPDSWFKLFYDIFISILIIFNIIITPLIIGGIINNIILDYIMIVCDVIFIIDLFINFFTAYYSDENELIYELPKIALNYLSTWFVIDLLGSVPIYTIVYIIDTTIGFKGKYQIFKFFRLLKLLRLSKLYKMYSNYVDLVGINLHFKKILNVLCSSFMLMHIFGCIWSYMPELKGNNVSWSDVNNVNGIFKYLPALYWSFTTITTVGYNDIKPQNGNEYIFVIIIMIITPYIFSYTIGYIAKLVKELNIGMGNSNKIERSMISYMHERKLPPVMINRVYKYYSYYKKIKSTLDENPIFEKVPENLRNELISFIYKDSINKIPLFDNETDLNFISYTIMIMYV